MPPRAAPQAWTTRTLLEWMTEAFTRADIDSPRHCAELLLAHVLGCERLRLYMDADRPAAPLERETLRTLVARALKHEPVQYLVAEAWFFGMPFHVDPRVLIPRPCTEGLVEAATRHARAQPGFDRARFADVCTGSGCVAVALLKALPESRAIASDVSDDALAVARDNAARHHVADRLDLVRGDLLAPVREHAAGRDLHFILANPPYIPDHEWADVAPNVKDFEPTLALRGGADGLDFVRRILTEAPAALREGGLLAVEIAASTADAALELARANPALDAPRLENDHEGHRRFVVATKN